MLVRTTEVYMESLLEDLFLHRCTNKGKNNYLIYFIYKYNTFRRAVHNDHRDLPLPSTNPRQYIYTLCYLVCG